MALYDDPVLVRGCGALCSPTGLVSTASPGTVALSAWRRGRRMGQDGAGNGPQAGTHENSRSPPARRGRAGRQARQGDPRAPRSCAAARAARRRAPQAAMTQGSATGAGPTSLVFRCNAAAGGRARQNSPRPRLKTPPRRGWRRDPERCRTTGTGRRGRDDARASISAPARWARPQGCALDAGPVAITRYSMIDLEGCSEPTGELPSSRPAPILILGGCEVHVAAAGRLEASISR